MSDLYLDQDESSPFFQEIFAERRNDLLLAHIRLGGSPLTFQRQSKPCAVSQLDEAALATPNTPTTNAGFDLAALFLGDEPSLHTGENMDELPHLIQQTIEDYISSLKSDASANSQFGVGT